MHFADRVRIFLTFVRVRDTTAGCLGALLEEAARVEGVLIPAEVLRSDGKTIGSITANNTKGTIEISDDGAIIDPGRGEGTANGEASGEEGDSQEEDDEDKHPTRIKLPSGAWMPYDIMVGVSIGNGRGNAGRRFWGLRGSADAGNGRRLADGDGGGEEGGEEGGEVEDEVRGAGGDAEAAAISLGGNGSVATVNGTR